MSPQFEAPISSTLPAVIILVQTKKIRVYKKNAQKYTSPANIRQNYRVACGRGATPIDWYMDGANSM